MRSEPSREYLRRQGLEMILRSRGGSSHGPSFSSSAFLLVAFSGACWAQGNGAGPVFEVISIKPSASGTQSIVFKLPGGRLRADKVTLKILVTYAYDLP